MGHGWRGKGTLKTTIHRHVGLSQLPKTVSKPYIPLLLCNEDAVYLFYLPLCKINVCSCSHCKVRKSNACDSNLHSVVLKFLLRAFLKMICYLVFVCIEICVHHSFFFLKINSNF